MEVMRVLVIVSVYITDTARRFKRLCIRILLGSSLGEIRAILVEVTTDSFPVTSISLFADRTNILENLQTKINVTLQVYRM